MKTLLYPKLAKEGISKNRKIYIPYIITCTVMVMMQYIISFMAVNEDISRFPAGWNLQFVLTLGGGVMTVFSLIFLFYTNSFLMRRRKKEFGLYNILGMGKRNLFKIILWENFMIYLISIGAGLLSGIVFSKLSQLIMLRLLGSEDSFAFTVEGKSVAFTVIVFGVIFTLILLNAFRQVRISNPVELLRSEAFGEKPPKANWVLAVGGAVILAAAYYLANRLSTNAMVSLMVFFVAVIMVIIATYLLFIAGSVAFLKLLQRNKSYYYRTNHFVSVSSMIYRMKRNGAGLASICILSTMVLVMVSTAVCMYAGTEDSIREKYPRNIGIETYSSDQRQIDAVRSVAEGVLAEKGQKAENILEYSYVELMGYGDEKIFLSLDTIEESQAVSYDDIKNLFFIPLEDYNAMTGGNEILAGDEVLLYADYDYKNSSIEIDGAGAMKVKKIVPKFQAVSSKAMITAVDSMYIILPDMADLMDIYELWTEVNGTEAEVSGAVGSALRNFYGFDLSADRETQIEIYGVLGEKLIYAQTGESQNSGLPPLSIYGAAVSENDFYATYGGILFVGSVLGLVFVFAMALIMYYKQITEGYEDRRRFEIMQNVGMTKGEIKKSITSQMITVFFVPLSMAGLHVIMAFKMISILLALFGLVNTVFFIKIMLICYAVFGLCYVLMYMATSRLYYKIVSA